MVRDTAGLPRYRVGQPYKRDRTWYGRATDLKTRKRQIVNTGAHTKAKAIEATVDWCQLQVRKSTGHAARGVLFEAAFEEWLSLKTVRPSTMENYRYDLDGVYSPTFGGMDVGDITYADIQRFLKKLASKGQTARNRSKHLIQLRSFFRWAVRMKYATENPCGTRDDLKVGRGEKRRGIALDFDEARRLLVACRESVTIDMEDRRRKWKQTFKPPEHLFLAVAIALYTGLRRGNVLGLCWRHVDLGKRRIAIPAKEMKGKEDHEVPIHPQLETLLRARLAGRKKIDPDEPVIGGNVALIRKSFKTALRRAELPDLRWHDLRHVFSSWIAMRAPYAVHQALMGHAPRTVTDVYTHVGWAEKREAIEKLPQLLPPLAPSSQAKAR